MKNQNQPRAVSAGTYKVLRANVASKQRGSDRDPVHVPGEVGYSRRHHVTLHKRTWNYYTRLQPGVTPVVTTLLYRRVPGVTMLHYKSTYSYHIT